LVTISPEGKLTDVLYNASLYKDTRGAVAGVFAAASDVTARKKAEEELAERRRRTWPSWKLQCLT